MLKNIFVKKNLPLAFASTPALLSFRDLAHVFIVLYYAQCRVKDAKCKLSKTEMSIGSLETCLCMNLSLECAYICKLDAVNLELTCLCLS
ncbi:hypothetical protein PAMP_002804 [Pampus punctatissimus]